MNLWYAGELKALSGISAEIKGWEPPWPCFKDLSPSAEIQSLPLDVNVSKMTEQKN